MAYFMILSALRLERLSSGGYYAGRFDNRRLSSTQAKIKGDLFKAGGESFPGIALGGDNDVFGEIHEYSDADIVKERMDSIEGYWEGRKNNLFNRKEVEVTTKDGKIITAFVYEYGEPDELRGTRERIETGKWEVKGLDEIDSF